jgi:hypothetical protein
MIRGKDLPTLYPRTYSLPGVVDIHVHTGQGLTDALDLGRKATEAGVRAIVFKTPSPTLDLAITVNEALAELYRDSELSPVSCVGSFILDIAGPPNPAGAERWLRKGTKVLWFGTHTAANHMERALGVPRSKARRQGQFLLNNGALIKEAEAALEMAGAYKAAISFGHLSNEEMYALAASCERRGITNAFVDHPFNPVCAMPVEGMKRLASHGVWINVTAAELAPMFGIDPLVIGDAVREIGVDHIVLSSDGGHPTMGDPVESMRLWQVIMEWQGFSTKEIQAMTCDHPARVLGLP